MKIYFGWTSRESPWASALTTRITIVPVDAPLAVGGDGALVERAWPAAVARIRTLPRERTIRSGSLALVARAFQRRTGGPESPALQVPERPALQIEVNAGDARTVQRLATDQLTGALSFLSGSGPLLGLFHSPHPLPQQLLRLPAGLHSPSPFPVLNVFLSKCGSSRANFGEVTFRSDISALSRYSFTSAPSNAKISA